MAKIPKIKPKASSTKSRAARRETSPSINLDKSLKDVVRPSVEQNVQILAANTGANISKTKKQKHLSRQQRLRKERGMARADVVSDKMQYKVGKSKARGKVIKDRRIPWEELNNNAQVRLPQAKKGQKTKSKTELKTHTPKVEVDGMNDLQGPGNTSEDYEEDAEEQIPDPEAALVDWGQEIDVIE